MLTQHIDYTFEASIKTNPQYRRFRKFSYCSELSEEESVALFYCFESRTIAGGTIIYEQDSRLMQSKCLITRGKPSVSRTGYHVSYFEEGDVLDLSSVLDSEGSYQVTVTAATELELLTINRQQLSLINIESPALGDLLLHFLSRISQRPQHEVQQYSSILRQGVSDA